MRTLGATMTLPPDNAPDSTDLLPIDCCSRVFICPECGSMKTIERLPGSRESGLNLEDLWTRVLQTETCAQCGRTIPAHLGFRWRVTLEQARAQWRARHRHRSD